MAIKLYIISSAGSVDVTQLIRTITWSGDYQQCARTLDFDLLASPVDTNVPAVTCELGNSVLFMMDDRILFSGYVFRRQKTTSSSYISVACFDRGIYLKRNEAVYKFTGMTPEAITKRICSDFGITTGAIAETGVKISRNFVGISLYSIIQTAYTLASKSTGEKYQALFKGDQLSIIKKGITADTLILSGGSNLMSVSTTESIENMINQVRIYNTKDVLVGTQSNADLIKLYGLLQSYLKQADNENATAEAKQLLANNGITQKITVENLGNIVNITSGSVVVREPYTGVYGLFYIDSDAHTWKNGQYYNKLVINFRRIMDEQEAGEIINASGNQAGSWQYLYKPEGG